MGDPVTLIIGLVGILFAGTLGSYQGYKITVGDDNAVSFVEWLKIFPKKKPFENAKLAAAVRIEFVREYMGVPYNVTNASVNLTEGTILYSTLRPVEDRFKVPDEFMGLKTVPTNICKPEKS